MHQSKLRQNNAPKITWDKTSKVPHHRKQTSRKQITSSNDSVLLSSSDDEIDLSSPWKSAYNKKTLSTSSLESLSDISLSSVSDIDKINKVKRFSSTSYLDRKTKISRKSGYSTKPSDCFTTGYSSLDSSSISLSNYSSIDLSSYDHIELSDTSSSTRNLLDFPTDQTSAGFSFNGNNLFGSHRAIVRRVTGSTCSLPGDYSKRHDPDYDHVTTNTPLTRDDVMHSTYNCVCHLCQPCEKCGHSQTTSTPRRCHSGNIQNLVNNSFPQARTARTNPYAMNMASVENADKITPRAIQLRQTNSIDFLLNETRNEESGKVNWAPQCRKELQPAVFIKESAYGYQNGSSESPHAEYCPCKECQGPDRKGPFTSTPKYDQNNTQTAYDHSYYRSHPSSVDETGTKNILNHWKSESRTLMHTPDRLASGAAVENSKDDFEIPSIDQGIIDKSRAIMDKYLYKNTQYDSTETQPGVFMHDSFELPRYSRNESYMDNNTLFPTDNEATKLLMNNSFKATKGAACATPLYEAEVTGHENPYHHTCLLEKDVLLNRTPQYGTLNNLTADEENASAIQHHQKWTVKDNVGDRDLRGSVGDEPFQDTRTMWFRTCSPIAESVQRNIAELSPRKDCHNPKQNDKSSRVEPNSERIFQLYYGDEIDSQTFASLEDGPVTYDLELPAQSPLSHNLMRGYVSVIDRSCDETHLIQESPLDTIGVFNPRTVSPMLTKSKSREASREASPESERGRKRHPPQSALTSDGNQSIIGPEYREQTWTVRDRSPQCDSKTRSKVYQPPLSPDIMSLWSTGEDNQPENSIFAPETEQGSKSTRSWPQNAEQCTPGFGRPTRKTMRPEDGGNMNSFSIGNSGATSFWKNVPKREMLMDNFIDSMRTENNATYYEALADHYATLQCQSDSRCKENNYGLQWPSMRTGKDATRSGSDKYDADNKTSTPITERNQTRHESELTQMQMPQNHLISTDRNKDAKQFSFGNLSPIAYNDETREGVDGVNCSRRSADQKTPTTSALYEYQRQGTRSPVPPILNSLGPQLHGNKPRIGYFDGSRHISSPRYKQSIQDKQWFAPVYVPVIAHSSNETHQFDTTRVSTSRPSSPLPTQFDSRQTNRDISPECERGHNRQYHSNKSPIGYFDDSIHISSPRYERRINDSPTQRLVDERDFDLQLSIQKEAVPDNLRIYQDRDSSNFADSGTFSHHSSNETRQFDTTHVSTSRPSSPLPTQFDSRHTNRDISQESERDHNRQYQSNSSRIGYFDGSRQISSPRHEQPSPNKELSTRGYVPVIDHSNNETRQFDTTHISNSRPSSPLYAQFESRQTSRDISPESERDHNRQYQSDHNRQYQSTFADSGKVSHQRGEDGVSLATPINKYINHKQPKSDQRECLPDIPDISRKGDASTVADNAKFSNQNAEDGASFATGTKHFVPHKQQTCDQKESFLDSPGISQDRDSSMFTDSGNFSNECAEDSLATSTAQFVNHKQHKYDQRERLLDNPDTSRERDSSTFADSGKVNHRRNKDNASKATHANNNIDQKEQKCVQNDSDLNNPDASPERDSSMFTDSGNFSHQSGSRQMPSPRSERQSNDTQVRRLVDDFDLNSSNQKEKPLDNLSIPQERDSSTFADIGKVNHRRDQDSASKATHTNNKINHKEQKCDQNDSILNNPEASRERDSSTFTDSGNFSHQSGSRQMPSPRSEPQSNDTQVRRLVDDFDLNSSNQKEKPLDNLSIPQEKDSSRFADIGKVNHRRDKDGVSNATSANKYIDHKEQKCDQNDSLLNNPDTSRERTLSTFADSGNFTHQSVEAGPSLATGTNQFVKHKQQTCDQKESFLDSHSISQDRNSNIFTDSHQCAKDGLATSINHFVKHKQETCDQRECLNQDKLSSRKILSTSLQITTNQQSPNIDYVGSPVAQENQKDLVNQSSMCTKIGNHNKNQDKNAPKGKKKRKRKSKKKKLVNIKEASKMTGAQADDTSEELGKEIATTKTANKGDILRRNIDFCRSAALFQTPSVSYRQISNRYKGLNVSALSDIARLFTPIVLPPVQNLPLFNVPSEETVSSTDSCHNQSDKALTVSPTPGMKEICNVTTRRNNEYRAASTSSSVRFEHADNTVKTPERHTRCDRSDVPSNYSYEVDDLEELEVCEDTEGISLRDELALAMSKEEQEFQTFKHPKTNGSISSEIEIMEFYDETISYMPAALFTTGDDSANSEAESSDTEFPDYRYLNQNSVDKSIERTRYEQEIPQLDHPWLNRRVNDTCGNVMPTTLLPGRVPTSSSASGLALERCLSPDSDHPVITIPLSDEDTSSLDEDHMCTTADVFQRLGLSQRLIIEPNNNRHLVAIRGTGVDTHDEVIQAWLRLNPLEHYEYNLSFAIETPELEPLRRSQRYLWDFSQYVEEAVGIVRYTELLHPLDTSLFVIGYLCSRYFFLSRSHR